VRFDCWGVVSAGASMTGVSGKEGLAIWADWVPHTEHEEAWFSDTHGPAHAFYCNFSGVVLVFWVYDFAVIVIVAREYGHNIADT